MSVISSVDPVAAPLGPQAREQREQPHRPPVDFGGAVTHRELVDAKLRVDPVALAQKKQKTQQTRPRIEDPPPEKDRPEPPPERAYEEPGSYVDMRV